MITRDWKVAQVLDTYPETLEAFLDASPHFSKLNNKILRNTIARRVTLEQAARVGGIELTTLLLSLNRKAGIVMKASEPNIQHTHNEQTTEADTQTSVSRPPADAQEIVLDVRPIIDSGRDPFKEIMQAVKSMTNGDVLHIINSFEPIPLYSVLAGRGFAHSADLQGDEWHVRFWKDTNDTAPDAGGSIDAAAESGGHQNNFVEIDVRGLQPPEPMMKILETLNTLADDAILMVKHEREPIFLYDKLHERGYTAITSRVSDAYYKIIITKESPETNDR
jgi:uncharacterized protein (DUF2249 family)